MPGIPIVCAWNGCEERFNGSLPPGWIWLATFWRVARPGILNFGTDQVHRDAALCPAHAATLEESLKRI